LGSAFFEWVGNFNRRIITRANVVAFVHAGSGNEVFAYAFDGAANRLGINSNAPLY
jgi:hypothetical protein